MNPVASPENFEAESALLREILKATPRASGPLPPLVEEKSGWDELLKKIMDYIDRLFHGSSWSLSSGVGDFIRPLIYLILFLLVLWLLIRLLSPLFTSKSLRRPAGSDDFRPGRMGMEDLQVRLDSALKAGQVGLAGRIRWKVFLFRTRRPETATPLEVLGREKQEVASPWYALMFGPSAELEGYRSFDEQLKKGEGGIGF